MPQDSDDLNGGAVASIDIKGSPRHSAFLSTLVQVLQVAITGNYGRVDLQAATTPPISISPPSVSPLPNHLAFSFGHLATYIA